MNNISSNQNNTPLSIKLLSILLFAELITIVICIWYDPQYVSGAETQQKIVVTAILAFVITIIAMGIITDINEEEEEMVPNMEKAKTRKKKKKKLKH